jgi:hypothetical protein
MGWVSSPLGSCPPNPILVCSLSIAPSFSNSEQKVTCEKPVRKQGHEVLEEPPSPGPQGSFWN